MEEEIIILNRVVREDISEELTFKQRPEKKIGRKWVAKERVLGRRTGWCKGPEARGNLRYPATKREQMWGGGSNG